MKMLQKRSRHLEWTFLFKKIYSLLCRMFAFVWAKKLFAVLLSLSVDS